MQRRHCSEDISLIFHIFRRLSRKVCSFSVLISMSLMNIFRVLLATLKYLGKCPCPRCLIKKIHIFEMGTENDRTWQNTVHVDSQPRQMSVKKACKLIFQCGRAVNSNAVDKALGLRSEIPMHVSCYCGFLSSHVALTLV